MLYLPGWWFQPLLWYMVNLGSQVFDTGVSRNKCLTKKGINDEGIEVGAK